VKQTIDHFSNEYIIISMTVDDSSRVGLADLSSV